MKTIEELEALVETLTRERDVETNSALMFESDWKDACRERDELRAWQLQVAEPIGFVLRAFGVGGYDVAEPAVLVNAWRALERERDEARETIVALTTAKAEADLEIAAITAALDERDVEAERGLEQYDSLVHQLADQTNETTHWQVMCKREGEEIERLARQVELLTDERDELLVRVANQDAELRATREAYTRSHAILRAIHGALTDALPNTPIPALDSFDVVELVRNIVAECERMKTFAAANFSAMIRQEAEQMREYGLSYEGVRKVLREHDDGEISFGKLMDLIRAAARAMAEDMK